MTMTLIQTVSAPSNQTSLDFSSIPATYTDLFIVWSNRSTRAAAANDGVGIRINGTTSGYTSRLLQGNGASAASYNAAGTLIWAGEMPGAAVAANTFGSTSIYIPNYAGGNYKNVFVDNTHESNGSTAFTTQTVASWDNASAITSISLLPKDGGLMAQYSTASLYGILKGSGGATVS